MPFVRYFSVILVKDLVFVGAASLTCHGSAIVSYGSGKLLHVELLFCKLCFFVFDVLRSLMSEL